MHMADMRNVIFMRCTQSEYDKLKSSDLINDNMIYYITDGANIYQGKVLYGTKFVDTVANGNTVIEPHTFRYNKNTNEVKYYTESGSFITVRPKDEDVANLISADLE